MASRKDGLPTTIISLSQGPVWGAASGRLVTPTETVSVMMAARTAQGGGIRRRVQMPDQSDHANALDTSPTHPSQLIWPSVRMLAACERNVEESARGHEQ